MIFGLFRRRREPVRERLTGGYMGRGWAQPHTLGAAVAVPLQVVDKLELVMGDRIEFSVDAGTAIDVVCYARAAQRGA